MKKLLFIFCVFISASCFAQPVVNRSSNVVTVVDGNLFTGRSFKVPSFSDTTAANAVPTLDSCGKLLYTYDVNGIWYRQCFPKKWVRLLSTGTSGIFVDSIYSSPSTKTDTLIYTKNGDSVQVKVYDRNCGLISPGTITYDSLLIFTVAPSIYILCTDGIRRTPTLTNVTLSPADGTFDRRDAIILDATGVSVLTGVPSATPEDPQINPDQILLTFITVPATATVIPACSTPDYTVWDENTGTPEATVSGTVTKNANNTTTPYHLTKAIDVGSFTNGQTLILTPPSAIAVRSYTSLKFFIRLKSTFNPNTSIQVSWVTSAGNATVNILDGTYNFNRKTVGSYQPIIIPINDFNAPNAGVAFQLTVASAVTLKFTMIGSNSNGFYLDYVQLGGGCIVQPNPTPNTNITADNGLNMSTPTNVQLGGTLIKNTTVDGTSQYQMNFTSAQTGSPTVLVTNSSTGTALQGTGSNGNTGVYGLSNTGTGIGGYSNTGQAGSFIINPSDASTSVEMMHYQRETSGTAADGIGGYAAVWTKTTGGTIQETARFLTKLTTANTATNTGQYEMYLKNIGSLQQVFTLSGAGQLTLNRYLPSLFNGGAAADSVLVVTSTGVVKKRNTSSFGGLTAITADNGLTANTSSNVQLGSTTNVGSPLLHDTYINATASYSLFVTGSALYTLRVDNSAANYSGYFNNSGGGVALLANSTGAGLGLDAYSGTSTAVRGQSSSGSGVNGVSITGKGGSFQVTPSSTNTVVPVLEVIRTSSGSPTAGIGGSINFATVTTDGTTTKIGNQLISKLTTATTGAETSQFIITGVNSATTGDIAYFNGNGMVGIGSSSADATRLNVVDNSVGAASIVNISSTSTAAASNVQKGINVSLNGANATSSQSTFGIYVANTHTGTSVNNYGLFATQSGDGWAITGAATSTGGGVNGYSDSYVGGYFQSTSNTGVIGVSNSGHPAEFFVVPSSTNTVVSNTAMYRNTSGTSANGIGESLDFYIKTDNNNYRLANQFISKLTTATDATRTSSLVFTGLLSTATVNLLTLAGDGSMTMRPITATAASAITPAEGMILFVSDTNGTFVSIGIWAYYNAAWHAL